MKWSAPRKKAFVCGWCVSSEFFSDRRMVDFVLNLESFAGFIFSFHFISFRLQTTQHINPTSNINIKHNITHHISHTTSQLPQPPQPTLHITHHTTTPTTPTSTSTHQHINNTSTTHQHTSTSTSTHIFTPTRTSTHQQHINNTSTQQQHNSTHTFTPRRCRMRSVILPF